MTPQEYFGDWANLIDFNELNNVLLELQKVSPELLCPSQNNVFRAFKLCSYKECKQVWIGMDPYSKKDVATGILFGNNKETKEINLSPSLRVIKESCIDPEIPHKTIIFDNTLESWAKQGILMLNSALTCIVNKTGSHMMLWRKFIATFIKNLSLRDSGIIYVLFGSQAQTFEPYINSKCNYIIKSHHPSYFARINKSMPHTIFTIIDKVLIDTYGQTVQWYTEY